MTYTTEVSLLLVEDNDTDYLLFQEIINRVRDFFIDLKRVASLGEAVAILKEDRFDIVFLDLYLPDSQGRDTFESLKPLAGAIPIVILSGVSDRQLTLDIVNAGAQDYLVKGEIERIVLEKTIDHSIERKKYQDRLEQSERKYRTTFESVGVAIGEYDYSELYDYVINLSKQEADNLLIDLEINYVRALEIRDKIKLTGANQAALQLFEVETLDGLNNQLHEIYTEGYNQHILKFVACILDKEDYYEQEMRYRTKSKGVICVLNRVRVMGGVFGFHRALISSVNITRLKEQEQQLNELNEDLENRVQERTAQLVELNKELESFSYSVSHDLRAPLRAISGFSRMLRKRIEDNIGEKEEHYLNNIENGATEMSSLIDNLLDFSRMGRRALSHSVINMKEACDRISQDLLLQVPDRKIDIQVSDLDQSLGDPSMIRQVLINLIWNAIKYSVDKEYAVILISSEVKGEYIQYTFKDNGMGFDMNYADKLFGVFQRLHQDTDIEGTGAGLAIVQRIIKRHGGNITAEGIVGEGATFRFTLPREEQE